MNDDTCYIICEGCKVGQIEDPKRPNHGFAEKHGNHGHIDIVPEAIFLSQHLSRGFKDVDRPDLVPLQLESSAKSSGSIGQNAPFGYPEPKKKPKVARQPGFGKHMTGEEVLSAISATRPDWDHYFMAVAEVIKTRGTCSRLKVGAVVVDRTHTIVSTGYNGAPRGLAHCDHTPLEIMDRAPGREFNGVDDGHCIVAEHAERNALLFADRMRALGATLYITVEPCLTCCRMAITMGIARIVYSSKYKPTHAVPELCKRAGIQLVRLDQSL